MTYRYPGGLVRRTAANTSITGASGVWDLGSQAQAVKTNTWPISGLANPVSGSLRFRSSASATLTRSVPGVNTTQLTFSCWFKYGVNANDNVLFSTQNNSSNYLYIGLNSSFALDVQIGATANRRITTQVFRDPSAWYHLVVTFDSTQATAANRIRIYVNGSEVTAFSTSTTGMSQNANLPSISSTLTNYIGGYNGSAGFYFDGYMAEINCVYSQALTPSSFGQTSPITGVWEPIKYTGTYGTNGFYLSLSDTSSIGKDFSGNGNNWTPNNISTASGSTFDLMRDVPTQWAPQGVTDVGGTVRGNYCTLNPLDFTTVGTISNGNLRFAQSSSGARSGRATFGVSSGKWYWEYTHLGGNSSPGIGNASMTLDYYCGGNVNGWSYFVGGAKYNNDVGTSYGASYTTNDVIGVALDMDAGTLVFYKNGASQGTAFSSLTGTMFPAFSSSSVSNVTFTVNFGQQPFAYTPPSGFKSLCTTNLPTPTIGATTATAANKYFDATLYTGNGGTQTITNAGGFQPDFIWEKARSDAFSHMLYNSISGVGKYLRTNVTSAEVTDSTTLTAFNSNGFTVGAGDNGNNSGSTAVAWQWNAGGSTVTNTAGSISSQVRANPTAGFSIVTYTGNATSSQTVGHGLGTTPTFFILKSRGIQVWNVYSLAGGIIGNTILQLNTTDAAVTGGNISLTASPTTIGFGSASQVNGSGVGFVAYVFAPVAGYSAFGSYTGNGSADGTFVYTGFRPRFVLYKSATSASVGDWRIHDTSRSTFNAAQLEIYAQSAAAEPASSNAQADILSNGFKLRGVSGNTSWNESGVTYIYAAFAEFPFKNSLAR